MRPRGNTQEDYLIRMIQQAAEVLRRLRHRLTGGGGSPEEVRRDRAGPVEAQHPVRVARPDVVHLWAALLDVQAGGSEPDDVAASRLRSRAQSLREAAIALWDAPS